MKIKFLPATPFMALMQKDSRIDAMRSILDNDAQTPWWLVSITEGTGTVIFPMEFMAAMGCKAVLPLAFDDIDPKRGKGNMTDIYRIFNEHHADRIISFFDWIHQSHRVIVHCAAGISRSAAVATFAHEYFGVEQSPEFIKKAGRANMHVLQVLRRQAGFLNPNPERQEDE